MVNARTQTHNKKSETRIIQRRKRSTLFEVGEDDVSYKGSVVVATNERYRYADATDPAAREGGKTLTASPGSALHTS